MSQLYFWGIWLGGFFVGLGLGGILAIMLDRKIGPR